MNHSFDVEVATKYGVNAAILLQNIQFWCAKNRANGVNFHDGLYWTYNSRKALAELFPYMSAKQIKSALDKLVEDGLVVVSNFNDDSRDRTLWYAVTEKGDCILQNGTSHDAKRSNANAEKVKALPDIKQTDINTDISKNTSYSCPEPEESASTPPEPPVISLPLNDGTEYPVMQADIDKYISLYPSVDVMQQLRNMYGWLDSHRNRRKTKSGIKGFITTWLAKEQDKGITPPRATGGNADAYQSRQQAEDAEQQARDKAYLDRVLTRDLI